MKHDFFKSKTVHIWKRKNDFLEIEIDKFNQTSFAN